MALIKCTECGRDISDKATFCVHCGCPMCEIEKRYTIDENKDRSDGNILVTVGGKKDLNRTFNEAVLDTVENSTVPEQSKRNDVLGFNDNYVNLKKVNDEIVVKRKKRNKIIAITVSLMTIVIILIVSLSHRSILMGEWNASGQNYFYTLMIHRDTVDISLYGSEDVAKYTYKYVSADIKNLKLNDKCRSTYTIIGAFVAYDPTIQRSPLYIHRPHLFLFMKDNNNNYKIATYAIYGQDIGGDDDLAIDEINNAPYPLTETPGQDTGYLVEVWDVQNGKDEGSIVNSDSSLLQGEKYTFGDKVTSINFEFNNNQMIIDGTVYHNGDNVTISYNFNYIVINSKNINLRTGTAEYFNVLYGIVAYKFDMKGYVYPYLFLMLQDKENGENYIATYVNDNLLTPYATFVSYSKVSIAAFPFTVSTEYNTMGTAKMWRGKYSTSNTFGTPPVGLENSPQILSNINNSIAPSNDASQNNPESNLVIDFILHIVNNDELWIKYSDGRDELLTKDIPSPSILVDQDVSLDGKTAYLAIEGGTGHIPVLWSIDLDTRVINEVYVYTDVVQVIRTGKYTGNLLVKGDSSSSYVVIDNNGNIIADLTDEEYQLLSEERLIDADVSQDGPPSEEEIIAMEAETEP